MEPHEHQDGRAEDDFEPSVEGQLRSGRDVERAVDLFRTSYGAG